MTNSSESAPDQEFERMLDRWVADDSDIVALHLRQKLSPVGDSDNPVIFPPTYADIGYNIDSLSDGTKVAMINSIGSEANSMEPIFKQPKYSALVPQIEIELQSKGDGDEKRVERRSLLDLAHRIADAAVQASPSLSKLVNPAFRALKDRGDAGPLCLLAPTSLVFGVWDSRGGSGEKRPRLVRSIIRAWNVECLFSAAQFNSVWKHLSEKQRNSLKAESEDNRSDVGLADAPSTFRKVSDSAARQGMREFRDGSPNPERRVLGGVLVRGDIIREVTINLVALRGINGTLATEKGERKDESEATRRYLLALALLAATHDRDLYLREGCLLRYAGNEQWRQVPRRGDVPSSIDLSSDAALTNLLAYAVKQARTFQPHWPVGADLIHKFDLTAAKRLLQKQPTEEASQS